MDLHIDVLSDSTGDTCEKVVRAALLQFPQSGVTIRRHARIRTKERADPILKAAAKDDALLVFSVVSPELSAYLHSRSAELKINAIDVIGSVMGRLETYLGRKPINRPGALMPLSAEYFRRVEAVEFTVRSDAGRDPRNFLKADLVLVGVSRTSKTPVATLLAQRGLKVANFTVVLNSKLPIELERAPQDRIVGLTIDPESLCDIRQQRLRKLGMPAETQYAVREHVEQEIAYAEGLFRSHESWPVVNITGRSAEETAGIIIERMAARPSNAVAQATSSAV